MAGQVDTARSVERNAFTINEFAHRNTLSRNSIYREISDKRLRRIKVGSRTLITKAAEADWIALCEQEAGR